MSGTTKIEGPYQVTHDMDLGQWEIVEIVDGQPVLLRPRRIYPEEKRTAAYLQRVRMNRKWQQANKPEGDNHVQG